MIQKELLLQKIIRNPDLDLIGVWKGHGFSSQKNSRFDSRARIRIWKGEPNYVLFTDLDERDTGVSITNCCENLATLVRRDFELDEETIWYEHYSRANNPHLEEEFSEIKLQWNTQKNNYLRPIWKPLTKKSIEKAIAELNLRGEGARFKLWLQLKSGSDRFSKLRGEKLTSQVPDLVKDALWAVLTEKEKSEGLLDKCLRWWLRGLSAKCAVRKVRVDAEITANVAQKKKVR